MLSRIAQFYSYDTSAVLIKYKCSTLSCTGSETFFLAANTLRHANVCCLSSADACSLSHVLLNELILNVPIATKVVCFSRLLKCLRSLYGKQCGPRSDCSYRSSLFWIHTVCFYTSVMLGNYLQQTTSADNIFRYIFFLAL